jgi:transglutaminase-like putative cysteine protease
MNFEKFFKFISYAAVFCGFLSLWVSGSFGIVGTVLFIGGAVAAWLIEGSRWQLSERIGTALIVLALPFYYLASRLHLISLTGSPLDLPGTLTRLILTLTAIKLLQRKSDRDWIFLYLMAFFEVLLAAGLSISALYLASFVLYMLVMVCTVIAFEIRKTSRQVGERAIGLIKKDAETESENAISARRLPGMAIALIAFIVCLGLPLFFFLPRVGGAGFGGKGPSVGTSTGFSDHVQLGKIGTLQQNDEVVMRARLDDAVNEQTDLYWRGLALDTFDGQSWSRSDPGKEAYPRGERPLIALELAKSQTNLVSQTIYLEPLDTPVLFGLSKIIGIQTSLPAVLRDSDGGITSGLMSQSDRISYRVFSDRTQPSIDRLRSDNEKYSPTAERFLELPPNLDKRITQLASQVTASKATRYDRAAAVEHYLQTNFGYSLEMRAGGADPLADFLFNIREGHCEYFATAMAIMLRTQGIATRVVNGFHQGDYNESTNMYVVRQRHAHSWVEVYFPHEDAWIKFDPTPPAGQTAAGPGPGFAGRISKYLETLETYWIQYFVAYDNQEQQTLVRSVRRGLTDYQEQTVGFLNRVQAAIASWMSDLRGDQGGQARMSAVGRALFYVGGTVTIILLLVWLVRRVSTSRLWVRIADWLRWRRQRSVVEFYDRMQRILASKGFVREPHQTPLEFAFAVGMSEAVSLTQKYNGVRFGAKDVSESESAEIQNWLDGLSLMKAKHRAKEK